MYFQVKNTLKGNHNHISKRFWYCDSFCGCGLKKVFFIKTLLVEVGLVFIYIWLKLRLKN
jgi:hypothetical protein